MVIFQFLIIIFLLYFQFYSPFIFVIDKLELKLKACEKILITLMLGMAINCSLIFFVGNLAGTKAYNLSFLFIILGILNIKKSFSVIKNCLSEIKSNKIYFIIILISSLFLSSTLFLSGLKINEQIIFQEFQDSIWHISLIEKLKETIPPTHPSSFLISLKNYHYFYDLFLAILGKISGLSTFTLYFQFSTIFICLLLGLSSFLLGRRLMGKDMGLFLTIFTFFSGSLAYLIPLFIPGNSWHESSFWVSQTFATITNPQLTYSLSILFVILILILDLEGKKKLEKNWLTHLFIGFLIASSLGFKSYAFLVLGFLYGFYLLLNFFPSKKIINLVPILFLIILTAPFYLLLTGKGEFPFFWAPGWFLNVMIEAPDRLNYLEWKLAEDTYRFLGSNWGIFKIKIKEILVFFIGNLGIRSFFILSLWFVFWKNKSKLLKSILVTLTIFAILPLLLVQKGTIWNTIQFWYYVLILANISFVLGLSKLMKKIKIIWIKAIIVIIIAGFSLPTFVKYYSQRLKLSGLRLEYINFFTDNIKSNSKIFICPSDEVIYKTAFLSGLLDIESYLANPEQLELVGDNAKILESQAWNICHAQNIQLFEEVIKKYNIEYAVSDFGPFSALLRDRINGQYWEYEGKYVIKKIEL